MARQFRSDDTSIWQEGFGNGSNGSLTISSDSTFLNSSGSFINNANSFGAFTGTNGATSGSATDVYAFWTSYVSNGDFVLIHQTRGTGMGNWELNVIVSGIPTSGGGSSTINLKYPLQNTYNSGSQIIKCPQFSSVTVNTGVTLYPSALAGSGYGGILAFFCNGTTTITGSINASARGFRKGGDGNAIGQNTIGYAGENQTRGFNTTRAYTRENHSAGGGAGGLDGSRIPGAGSGGGYGTAGGSGGSGETGITAESGNTIGDAGLTALHFGGSGGAAGGRLNAVTQKGGNGGGIIFIISRDFINNGTLVTSGENGNNGNAGSYYPGGGAGAGGAILIKSQTATLGSSTITATGGTGGTGYSGVYGSQVGGNGGNGRIHIDYLSSYTGSTSPTLDARQDNSLYTKIGGGAFLYNLI